MQLEIGLEPVGLLMGVFEPEKFTQMYNCNVYNVEDISLENRQSIPLGIMFLTLGLICEILYIPCMVAMRKHMDNTCYKFMFYIAMADMLALFISGVLTGYLTLVGAVYCTAPKFIYFVGSWSVCLWITESTAEMVLAFNRCVEVSSSYWANVLFHGKRTYLWMMIPTLYGLYFLIFTTPGLFSGLFGSWFFNPHVGYIDDFGKTYHNDLHTIHNYIVVVGLTGIYFAFAIILTIKTWKLKNTQTGGVFSRSQKIVFHQSFILLNKTVRHDVYNMLLCLMSKVLCCVKLDAVGINTTMALQIGGPRFVHVAPTQFFRRTNNNIQVYAQSGR